MKNVEYCKSLYEYSKIGKDLKEYKKYIKDFNILYPNLYNFLIKKGEII